MSLGYGGATQIFFFLFVSTNRTEYHKSKSDRQKDMWSELPEVSGGAKKGYLNLWCFVQASLFLVQMSLPPRLQVRPEIF